MAKKDKYEYHKQNDYPGERVAERKRVEDREEEADLKGDARVAEKGRTESLKSNARAARKDRRHDKVIAAEMQKSKNRASRINNRRDRNDAISLMVIIGLILIISVGTVWGYTFIENQSDQMDNQAAEIDTLKLRLDNANLLMSENMEIDDNSANIDLYSDFILAPNTVRNEMMTINDPNADQSNMYQLCSIYAQRDKNNYDVFYQFAQKQIMYYRNIVILAEKPECETSVDNMHDALQESKQANDNFYVLTERLCYDLTDQPDNIDRNLRFNWQEARINADEKFELFTQAENKGRECLF